MAFVILTSCNVRKGIQQLVGQEVQKQLIPSKSISSQSELCTTAFDEIEAEVKNNSNTTDFSASFLSLDHILNIELEGIKISIAQTSQAIHKVGLYLLFKQLKTHH